MSCKFWWEGYEFCVLHPRESCLNIDECPYYEEGILGEEDEEEEEFPDDD